MKKMRQRLFSMLGYGRMLTRAGRVATALLAVAMLTMSAQTAKAEQTYYLYAKISNSDKTSMTLVCAESMPSESGYTFTRYNGSSWNDGFKNSVLSITTDISCRNYDGSSLEYFIYNFKELTSVDVSDLNTANVTNMNCMFCYCPKLTTINFGDGTYFKTDNVETMSFMFSDSKALTSLDLSGWNTAKVTDMKEMFNSCKALTTLDLSGWNTAKVTTMKSMFEDCEVLTSLNLSSFNTAEVTTMESMFDGCYALATLTLGSNFNTGNVTTMYNMFSHCRVLTSLDLSGWNTAKVENMFQVFNDCKALTSLNLSGWNTVKVTNMKNMFMSCKVLTSITGLSGLNTAAVTNMNDMFYQCQALTSLDLSGWNTAAVTNMGAMFEGCQSLTSLNLSGWNTAKVEGIANMFNGCSKLTSLDLSSFNTAAVTAMNGTFKGCTDLTTIWVGKDWTNSAVESGYKNDTFSGCTSLLGGNGTECDGSSNITADYAIADLGTAGPGYLSALKLLGSATAGVLTLTAGVPDGVKKTFNASSNWFGNDAAKAAITSIVVDASCQNATTITSLEYLFSGFTAATSITGLNNLNTANVTNMIGTFRDCQAVTLLDLSAWDTRNVTTSNNMTLMFKRCYELKTIIVGVNWIKPYSSDMFTDSKKIVGGYGATTATNPAAYIGSDNADTSETGYLTGTTRTLTATQAGTSGEYWATFFNSAVGYRITGGEAFTGVYNSSTQKVELKSLGTNIPANTPVVIRATSDEVNMTVDNTIAAYDGSNTLHGVDVETATPANSYCLAIGGSDNGDLNGKAGFFKYTGANIPARRAYLTISGGAGARGFIGFDNETTGIEAIAPQSTIDNEDGEVFDLQGRRVSGQLKKGIYAKNGKVLVIK